MNAIACVWRSKDQLWAVVSGSKHLCPLNHLSDSNLLMLAPIGMNFPQRAAFTVSYRFCYVVSLFSFNSGISSVVCCLISISLWILLLLLLLFFYFYLLLISWSVECKKWFQLSCVFETYFVSQCMIYFRESSRLPRRMCILQCWAEMLCGYLLSSFGPGCQ